MSSRSYALVSLGAIALLAQSLAAQDSTDSAFRSMQSRGHAAMGVDQYTSEHHFISTPDGGLISLERLTDDTAGIRQIRLHLYHIAQAFGTGDFSLPGFVHDTGEVPGTRLMRSRRDLIRYEYHDRPRGGEVRIGSSDSAAVAAVHEFLAFQRREHRTDGADLPH
jgi:hypothetical protein